MAHKPATPDPSPAEIAKLCRAIQATWTDAERMKRAGLLANGSGWLPPMPGTDERGLSSGSSLSSGSAAKI